MPAPLRRLLMIAGTVVFIASPAVASAAPSVTVTPAKLQAGGSPDVTTDAIFGASGGAAKALTIDLAPGFLSYATANPACLTTTMLLSSCQIGAGTVTTSAGLAVAIQMFLVPSAPGSSDFAGVDVRAAQPVNVTSTPASASRPAAVWP